MTARLEVASYKWRAGLEAPPYRDEALAGWGPAGLEAPPYGDEAPAGWRR